MVERKASVHYLVPAVSVDIADAETVKLRWVAVVMEGKCEQFAQFPVVLSVLVKISVCVGVIVVLAVLGSYLELGHRTLLLAVEVGRAHGGRHVGIFVAVVVGLVVSGVGVVMVFGEGHRTDAFLRPVFSVDYQHVVLGVLRCRGGIVDNAVAVGICRRPVVLAVCQILAPCVVGFVP